MSAANAILGTATRVRKFLPDVTLAHLEVLSVLALASEPLQPAEIAERTGLHRAHVSKLVKAGVMAELVDLRVHPTNFRFRVVELTDLGRGVMEGTK